MGQDRRVIRRRCRHGHGRVCWRIQAGRGRSERHQPHEQQCSWRSRRSLQAAAARGRAVPGQERAQTRTPQVALNPGGAAWRVARDQTLLPDTERPPHPCTGGRFCVVLVAHPRTSCQVAAEERGRATRILTQRPGCVCVRSVPQRECDEHKHGHGQHGQPNVRPPVVNTPTPFTAPTLLVLPVFYHSQARYQRHSYG